MQNLLDWDDIRYAGIIGVPDYELRLKIRKFKTADPI